MKKRMKRRKRRRRHQIEGTANNGVEGDEFMQRRNNEDYEEDLEDYSDSQGDLMIDEQQEDRDGILSSGIDEGQEDEGHGFGNGAKRPQKGVIFEDDTGGAGARLKGDARGRGSMPFWNNRMAQTQSQGF